jgi:hypothetical protein
MPGFIATGFFLSELRWHDSRVSSLSLPAPCGIAPRHDVLLCRHARGTPQRMATYRHCALGRVGNRRLDLHMAKRRGADQ